jgi:hypothetical protein
MTRSGRFRKGNGRIAAGNAAFTTKFLRPPPLAVSQEMLNRMISRI